MSKKNEAKNVSEKELVNKNFTEADKKVESALKLLKEARELYKPFTNVKGLGDRFGRFTLFVNKISGSKEQSLKQLEVYNRREAKEQEKAIKALKREKAKKEKAEKIIESLPTEALEALKAKIAESVKS